MRRDEAASLPPSHPCWSVGIISESISANGNLSASRYPLCCCDPFPTGRGRGDGKTRRGEKSGRRAHRGRCSKENGCFAAFFSFSIIVVGFSITFAAWKWYRVSDIWELEIPMDLIIVDIFFFFRVAKLILNSNFRYEAKSFSKNNREGREI